MIEKEKRRKVDLNEDFLNFDTVDENAFIAKPTKEKKSDENDSELENKITKRFDKTKYPWLSNKTLKIKDIFLFMHSEILDFVEFVSQSKEDKD